MKSTLFWQLHAYNQLLNLLQWSFSSNGHMTGDHVLLSVAFPDKIECEKKLAENLAKTEANNIDTRY